MSLFSSSTLRVLIGGGLILIVTIGIRQSFGLFLDPITVALDIGRQEFGFAIALQNLLWGFIQPFVGVLSDRLGYVWITVGGLLLYALGLGMLSLSTDTWGLLVSLGGVIGLALSATTYVTILGAVGQNVSPEKRSLAFGLCTAAGSIGMFIAVPGSQALLGNWPWDTSLILLLCLVLASLPLAFTLRSVGQQTIARPQPNIPFQTILARAGYHHGYWLLTLGFFVCGFHVLFIATHLPSYLTDQNISPTVSSWALACIGLFNILGSYVFGYLGGIMRQKYILSVLYFLRSVVICLFVIIPLSPVTAVMFGAAIGFLWLGTIPLTTGLVAHIFGTRCLAMLYGFVFMFHQFGSFLGAWSGGLVFDFFGSYDLIWLISIALGITATVLHLLIDDKPIEQFVHA